MSLHWRDRSTAKEKRIFRELLSWKCMGYRLWVSDSLCQNCDQIWIIIYCLQPNGSQYVQLCSRHIDASLFGLFDYASLMALEHRYVRQEIIFCHVFCCWANLPSSFAWLDRIPALDSLRFNRKLRGYFHSWRSDFQHTYIELQYTAVGKGCNLCIRFTISDYFGKVIHFSPSVTC